MSAFLDAKKNESAQPVAWAAQIMGGGAGAGQVEPPEKPPEQPKPKSIFQKFFNKRPSSAPKVQQPEKKSTVVNVPFAGLKKDESRPSHQRPTSSPNQAAVAQELQLPLFMKARIWKDVYLWLRANFFGKELPMEVEAKAHQVENFLLHALESDMCHDMKLRHAQDVERRLDSLSIRDNVIFRWDKIVICAQ